MWRLKFPNHMQDMIQYRGINIDHVRSAISEPDLTEPAYEGKTKVSKKVDESRTIKVVYYKDGFKDKKDYVIVTAYYTSN